jgi:hypothetical protein
MGTGNRSQGKIYWKKAVQYKLAQNASPDVIAQFSSSYRTWRGTNVNVTVYFPKKHN